MEKGIVKKLLTGAIVYVIYYVMLGFAILYIIALTNPKKYESTDVNHDGVTDIRDLAIVQKEIVERKWVRVKKNKKGLKKLIGLIFLAIFGLFYMLYYILKAIDSEVPKIFMKAPRIFRQLVIYTMIVLSVACFLGREETKVILSEPVQVEKPIEITEEEPVKEEIKEMTRPELECNLSEIECSIYYEALEQDLSEEQAYMIMAISKQETGHWSSSAFKNGNNLGGIMGTNGLKSYDTLEQGIKSMVHLLKNYYIDKGLDTLEKIQTKYCPIGASNDPAGLNNYWLKNTTIFYNEYLGGK